MSEPGFSERWEALTRSLYAHNQVASYAGNEMTGSVRATLIPNENAPRPYGAAEGYCETMAAGLDFDVEFGEFPNGKRYAQFTDNGGEKA